MLYNSRFTGIYAKNLPVISQRFTGTIGFQA